MQPELFKKQYIERLEAAKHMVDESNKASVLFIVQIPVSDNTDLLLPVTRESMSNVICFVEIGDEMMIDFILSEATGIIDRIVLDTDIIRPNSQRIIDYVLLHSSIPVMRYSDIQIWSDSAVDFIFQNEHDLQGKKILLCGNSFLTTRILMSFISNGVDIYMLTSDFNEGCFYIDIHSSIKIVSPFIHIVTQENQFDVLIGSNTKYIYNNEVLNKFKFKSIYDIGLQNFSGDYIKQWHCEGTSVYRFDSRAAVSSVILRLMETEDLIYNVMGETRILDIRLISGGIMGEYGDIVVDNVNNPTCIIGVANGYGSFVHDIDYTEKDIRSLKTIQSLLDKK